MSSLLTELLFLHGTIADPTLARRLVQPTSPPPPDTKPVVPPTSSLRRLTCRLCHGIGDGMLRRQ